MGGEHLEIRRARFVGPGLGAAAARLRGAVLFSAVRLPTAARPPSSLLLIRRLAVKAPAGRGRPPPAWSGAVADSLEQLAARAARPADGWLPADPEAVLFLDEAELLATLARELAAGLGERWYWRGLFGRGRPGAGAWLARARAVPHAVPGAVVILAGLEEGLRWVASLPEVELEALARAVAAKLAGSRPAVEARGSSEAQVAALPARLSAELGPGFASLLEVAARVEPAIVPLILERLRWPAPSPGGRRDQALGGAEPTNRATVPTPLRPELPIRWPAPTEPSPGVAVAVGHGGPEDVTRAVGPSSTSVSSIAAPPWVGASDPGSRLGPNPPEERAIAWRADSSSAGADADRAGARTAPPPLPEPSPRAGDPQPSRLGFEGARPGPAPGNAPCAPPPPAPAEVPPPASPAAEPSSWTAAEPVVLEGGVVTGLGGAFYLLAPLLALGAFERFARFEAAVGLEPPLGAWGLFELVLRAWVADLPGAALDPLFGVLAQLGGRDPRAPLRAGERAGSLEPPPEWMAAGAEASRLCGDPSWPLALARWIEAAARHLEVSLARALGLERPAEALRVPARIFVTRTHVDVVLRLEDASLPVRLAGLDRDPGWVPELGRVVLLHFT